MRLVYRRGDYGIALEKEALPGMVTVRVVHKEMIAGRVKWTQYLPSRGIDFPKWRGVWVCGYRKWYHWRTLPRILNRAQKYVGKLASKYPPGEVEVSFEQAVHEAKLFFAEMGMY